MDFGKRGALQFQFLKGSIKVQRMLFFLIVCFSFQFLKGSIKVLHWRTIISGVFAFQFLKGSIKVKQVLALSSRLHQVSIPKRFN